MELCLGLFTLFGCYMGVSWAILNQWAGLALFGSASEVFILKDHETDTKAKKYAAKLKNTFFWPHFKAASCAFLTDEIIP